MLAVAKDSLNPQVDCGAIPENVKGWPSRGNPYFFDVHRFALPKTTQEVWQNSMHENGDGLYDPCSGDYPIIDVKGCEAITAIPDQMVFWIYNDNGWCTHAVATLHARYKWRYKYRLLPTLPMMS